MSRLSILTNWPSTELCINIIPVELKTGLESYLDQINNEIKSEYPELKKNDLTLEDIWYETYDFRFVPNRHWKLGINLIDYTGPSFLNWDEIQKIISNKHDSKKMEILVDGMEINALPLWENCIFQEMIKPQLKQNELAVYCGGISWKETTFELDINKPFEESKLVLKFTDCDKHGYILNSIMYNREEMEKDYDPFKESFFDLKFLDGKVD